MTPNARPRPNRRLAVWCLCAAVPVSLVLACLPGPFAIPASEVLSQLASAAGLPASTATDPAVSLIVLELRLARVVLACLVGAGLAVSGTVFQGILRNPLADPFTLGVSSGAAFGASLAIFFAGALSASAALPGSSAADGVFPGLPGLGLLPLAALAGALLALGAVILLGRSGGTLRRETLVLAGIVVATFLSAFISLVKSLDEESVSAIVFWIMGSFQGRGWSHVQLFLPYFLLGLLPVWRYSRELDILALGDVQARQLGVDAGKVRLRLLVGASLLAGAAVAVSGVIGFVGLVVPHLIRLSFGGEHRPLLGLSALGGSVLLLWSDVLARTILPGGAELPVGVVTALLGGPFFCLLLRGRTGDRA